MSIYGTFLELGLPQIQHVWGCDRDTAKVLLRVAREGSEE